MDAAQEKYRMDQRTAVMGGWYAGFINRAKRPPSLQKVLKQFSRKRKSREYDWKQMKADHEARVAVHRKRHGDG